jgi:VWFA-related protein
MRICRLSPALVLFLIHAGIAQTTPDPVVIHTGTHVVLVNVVAKDKHGKPVNDLKRDDFVLRDNGQEQKIGLFALEEAGGASLQRSNFPAQLTFTNRPGAAGATVFLFDELNTQLTDQELAKKDFVRYLRELPPTSRVAVFVLGDSLSLLHDFSQDMASLLAALSKHANRVNPEVTASSAPPASSNSLTGDQTSTAQWDAFIKSSNQPYVNYTQTVRATRTAAALETIAGHLQGIPGRKTLIWISGGFPIQLGLHNKVDTIPDSNSSAREGSHGSGRRNGQGSEIGAASNGASSNSNPFNSSSSLSSSSGSAGELPGTGTSLANDVARAIRALNEADVAVYPVNARGVTVAGPYQADRSSMGKRNARPKAGFAPDFDDETLQTLAVETGGRAFHHINDLSSAFQEAADDAKVSYSLTFSPAAGSLDGTYHRLEVTVNRSGVKLRYRPGYVAAPDRAVAPSLADAIANPVDLAGIGFTVHLDKVEEGYKVSVVIDPRNVTLELKDGKWIGSLQLIVVVGKVEQLTTIPLNFTEALYRRVQDEGLQMGAQVKTPAGTTGFSLGFRDIPSGMVGTLHVPL